MTTREINGYLLKEVWILIISVILKEEKEEMKLEYLIWSNEHNAWWGPGRMGYTTEPSEAGRYSFEEASQICEDANRYSQEVQERMILIVEGGASEGQLNR